MEFGGEKRASRIFCWMKMNRFSTNFKMERSKNKILAKNGRKWPKIFFEIFWVEVGNLSNLANWIKNRCFLYGFYRSWSKNLIKNKEKVDLNEAS